MFARRAPTGSLRPRLAMNCGFVAVALALLIGGPGPAALAATDSIFDVLLRAGYQQSDSTLNECYDKLKGQARDSCLKPPGGVPVDEENQTASCMDLYRQTYCVNDRACELCDFYQASLMTVWLQEGVEKVLQGDTGICTNYYKPAAGQFTLCQLNLTSPASPPAGPGGSSSGGSGSDGTSKKWEGSTTTPKPITGGPGLIKASSVITFFIVVIIVALCGCTFLLMNVDEEEREGKKRRQMIAAKSAADSAQASKPGAGAGPGSKAPASAASKPASSAAGKANSSVAKSAAKSSAANPQAKSAAVKSAVVKSAAMVKSSSAAAPSASSSSPVAASQSKAASSSSADMAKTSSSTSGQAPAAGGEPSQANSSADAAAAASATSQAKTVEGPPAEVAPAK